MGSYGSFQQLAAPLRQVCGGCTGTCRDVWSLGYIGYGVQGFQKTGLSLPVCPFEKDDATLVVYRAPLLRSPYHIFSQLGIPHFVGRQGNNPHPSSEA